MYFNYKRIPRKKKKELKKFLKEKYNFLTLNQKLWFYLREINTGKKASEETKALLRSQRTSDKHSASKLVLCLETGVFYDSAKDASIAFNIKHSTLKGRLNGTVKNKTNLIYC